VRGGVEVGDLRAGMDTAIGAASAGDADCLAGDCGEGRFQDVLDCTAARLGLPAEKAAAVVLESYGNARNMELVRQS
jgi:hypothetical protein